jgi:hypothetical protein
MNSVGWIGLILLLLLAATTATLARPSQSGLPRGLTDYLGLSTEAVPPSNVSNVPQALTDSHERHIAAAPPTNFSPMPRGFTDYQGLNTVQPRSLTWVERLRQRVQVPIDAIRRYLAPWMQSWGRHGAGTAAPQP